MNDSINPEQENSGAEGRLQRILELLAGWIKTENWELSKRYLIEHRADLLSDEALAAMFAICQQEPEQAIFQMHLFLLHQSRSTSIEKAYAELQQKMRQAASEVQRESQRSRQTKQRREAPEKKKRFGEELETPIQLILLAIFVIWLVGWGWPEYRDMEVQRTIRSIEEMDPAEVTAYALENDYLTEAELQQIEMDAQGVADNLDYPLLIDEETERLRKASKLHLDLAYQQLIESSASGDVRTAVERAQSFLSSPSGHLDPRLEEVLDIYSSGLVTLIASQWPQPDTASADLVQTYRHLVVAPVLLQEAVALAVSGHIADALTAVETAQRYDPQTDVAASVWNELCLWGGLWGQAGLVMQACDAAVNDVGSDESALHKGTRAISRAQLGDYEGAASDFEMLDAWSQLKGERVPAYYDFHRWAQMLRSNQNPFTTSALADLRAEVYEALGLSSFTSD